MYMHKYISVYMSIYTLYILFPGASYFDTVKYRMLNYKRITVKLATVTFFSCIATQKLSV